MISVDLTNKVAQAGAKISRSSRKEGIKKSKFSAAAKSHEATAGDSAREVANIAPMLFLQEIDSHDSQWRELEDFSKKAIASLYDLQLALMEGNLKESHLHNIRDALKNNKTKFTTPALSLLATEIEIRLEVELAKIERQRSK